MSGKPTDEGRKDPNLAEPFVDPAAAAPRIAKRRQHKGYAPVPNQSLLARIGRREGEAATEEERLLELALRGVEDVGPSIAVGARGRLVAVNLDIDLDLDEVWDQLSRKQKVAAGRGARVKFEMRDAIADLGGIGFEPPRICTGELDGKKFNRVEENANAEVVRYCDALSPDVLAHMQNIVAEMLRQARAAQRQEELRGVDAAHLDQVFRDAVDRLMWQDVQSRRDGQGGNGVRTIAGIIELQRRVLDGLAKLGVKLSAKQRLLVHLCGVHEDMGFTAFAARTSAHGPALHRAYSVQIFDDVVPLYRKVFGPKEIEALQEAIATHAIPEYEPEDNPIHLAVRLADNLSALAPERVPLTLFEVPDAKVILEQMQAAVDVEDEEIYEERRRFLRRAVEVHCKNDALAQDIMSVIRHFDEAIPVDRPIAVCRSLSANRVGKCLESTLEPAEWSAFSDVLRLGQERMVDMRLEGYKLSMLDLSQRPLVVMQLPR